MKQLLTFFIALVLCFNGFAQRPFLLYSPDSALRLEIITGTQLAYKLFAGTQLLQSSSSVDLKLDNGLQLSDKLVVSMYKYRKVNELVNVAVPYRRPVISNHYQHLELIFKQPFSVEFRLYNNGMVLRVQNSAVMRMGY